MSLSLVYEFELPKSNICCGTLFSDGKIVLAKYESDKKGLSILSLKKDTWKSVQQVNSNDVFFDVLNTEREFYVTNQSNLSVLVMSMDTSTKVREFRMQDGLVPYGISRWKECLYIACVNAIMKYSLEGQFIQRYPVEPRTCYINVTNTGHIVYISKNTTDTVNCIDESGNVKWKYNNPKLRKPYNVEKDKFDNLYVCGSDSNNIHILSFNGSLIRIIEDIPCPAFVKLLEDFNMYCVCSSFKHIKVYEIN